MRDLLDALELRRPVAIGVTLLAVALGFATSYLAPGILPPHPLVGAAVGFAALAIGAVAAVAADAGDEVVQGPRHVEPTGAVVAGEGRRAVEDLVAWTSRRLAEAGHLRIAVVGAGPESAHAGPIADAIGRALARSGRRVLVADLSTERPDVAGLAEVGHGEARLSQVVEYAEGIDLARVRSGSSLTDALIALPRVAPRLVGDVEVLVAALPGLRHPGTLLGATAADRSLLLAVAGKTTRVDVIAGIQALDAARAPADLVIVPRGGVDLTVESDAPSPLDAIATVPVPPAPPEEADELSVEGGPPSEALEQEAEEEPEPEPTSELAPEPALDTGDEEEPETEPEPAFELGGEAELGGEPAPDTEADGEPGAEQELDLPAATEPEPATEHERVGVGEAEPAAEVAEKGRPTLFDEIEGELSDTDLDGSHEVPDLLEDTAPHEFVRVISADEAARYRETNAVVEPEDTRRAEDAEPAEDEVVDDEPEPPPEVRDEVRILDVDALESEEPLAEGVSASPVAEDAQPQPPPVPPKPPEQAIVRQELERIATVVALERELDERKPGSGDVA